MALINCKECGESISKKADKCPKCGAPQKKRTSSITWIAALTLGALFFGYLSKEHAPGTAATTASAPVKTEESSFDATLNNLKLDYTIGKAGFGNILQGNFTVTNSNKFPVKDIVIRCKNYAKSGTHLNNDEQTIYQVIPKSGKKTFNNVEVGLINPQSDSSSCAIIYFSLP